MRTYHINEKEIKPHNILYCVTSEMYYEMNRLILLEDMLYKHTDYIEKYLVSKSCEKYINKSLNNVAEWLFIFEK